MENDPTAINSLQLLSTAAGTLSTSTGNAKKRSSADKDLESLKKKLKQGSLNVVARDLAERKKKNGRMPHNAIVDAVKTLKSVMGVSTDRHVLLRLIKKVEQENKEDDINTVSPLANVEGGSDTLSPPENPVDSPTPPQPVKAKAKKGRPSGTTNADKVRLKKAKKDCIDEITRLFMEARKNMVQEENDDHATLPKGFLSDLIAAQKEVFNLPPEHNIPSQTIYSRLKPGRSLQPPHRGTPSPMATLEQLVVEIAIQMGRIRQPLTPTEALCLINGLIDKKPLQERLIIWKEAQNMDQPDEKKGKLGPGYWAGFMRRNSHLLVTKRGEKYATDRAEWLND
jgi:hypothetical protein